METQAPDRLYGYEVMDSAGKKIGKVDGIWVDDATNELEFVGVKTGWLMGKTHIIPAAQAQIDGGSQSITFPYAEDQIKDAPSFGTDAELSPDDENEVYSYYGMDRSTAPSPTDLPTGGGTETYGRADTTPSAYQETGYQGSDTGFSGETTDQENVNVPLSEEELQVGTRQVQAGNVRLRKVVRTEQQEVPVELRREEVSVERVPGSGQDAPDTAFQEQEINVPVTREEAVVGKEARVAGEVRVGKDVETEQRSVGGEVRKEDVEVERDTGTDVVDRT